jgi:hypothetical protein
VRINGAYVEPAMAGSLAMLVAPSAALVESKFLFLNCFDIGQLDDTTVSVLSMRLQVKFLIKLPTRRRSFLPVRGIGSINGLAEGSACCEMGRGREQIGAARVICEQ